MRRSHHQHLLILILASGALRLIFGGLIGLGVDESYAVAVGRDLKLSYFDHPPAMWWLFWASSHLFGSDSLLAVRLPFILSFGLTTYGLYRLTVLLFDQRAGLWAAVALNLSPVFSVTSGSWVLPDGPLNCALIWMGYALAAILWGRHPVRWSNWMSLGLLFGLAMLSKYIAVLTGLCVFIALLTLAQGRAWLIRPQPYLAALLAGLVLTPVLLWNIENGWASLAFQSGRAAVAELRPAMPFALLSGQAAYVLPWLWLPMIVLMVDAFAKGPKADDGRRWLLAWLAIGPIAVFTLVSLWSAQRVFPHWAAPGYLFLFPLLGAWAADHAPRVKPYAKASAALILVLLIGLVLDGRYAWLPANKGVLALESEIGPWTSAAKTIEANYAGPGRFVAVTSFRIAGKLDYALGGSVPLTIIDVDRRQYGFARPAEHFAGQTAILIDQDLSPAQAQAAYGAYFSTLRPLGKIPVIIGGRTVLILQAYEGTEYKP